MGAKVQVPGVQSSRQCPESDFVYVEISVNLQLMCPLISIQAICRVTALTIYVHSANQNSTISKYLI